MGKDQELMQAVKAEDVGAVQKLLQRPRPGKASLGLRNLFGVVRLVQCPGGFAAAVVRCQDFPEMPSSLAAPSAPRQTSAPCLRDLGVIAGDAALNLGGCGRKPDRLQTASERGLRLLRAPLGKGSGHGLSSTAAPSSNLGQPPRVRLLDAAADSGSEHARFAQEGFKCVTTCERSPHIYPLGAFIRDLRLPGASCRVPVQ
uniref:Uncharacterized protein n=1 Tax=Sphaerodactylus townsendi TaxID=933632 RepID=A0ACB8FKT1_9SAUR